MTAHPLLWAIGVADAVGVLLLLHAAVGSLRILLYWQPASASAQQLRLERLSEQLTTTAYLGLLFTTLATLGFVMAIAAVLPPLIPGAMCGTGVLENMGPAGMRALLFRGALIAMLLVWHLVQRIDTASPLSELTATSARLLAIIAPIAGVALFQLVKALSAIDVHAPVDCCAAVYTTAAAGLPLPGTVPPMFLTAGAALGATILTGMMIRLIRKPARHPRSIKAAALLSLVWVLWSAHALLRVFAPYHYGVLNHHCPWCLLLTVHHLVGIPFYLALFMVLAEGTALLIADAIGRRHPALAAPAGRRIRRGAMRLLIAVALFCALAAGPAIAWRLRYGVWITG